jgi:hypothetical protein
VWQIAKMWLLILACIFCLALAGGLVFTFLLYLVTSFVLTSPKIPRRAEAIARHAWFNGASADRLQDLAEQAAAGGPACWLFDRQANFFKADRKPDGPGEETSNDGQFEREAKEHGFADYAVLRIRQDRRYTPDEVLVMIAEEVEHLYHQRR